MDADALRQLDAELFLWINRTGGSAWDLVMGYGTELGHGLVLIPLLLAGLYFFDRRRIPKNFLLIALAVGLAGLASRGLKAETTRLRPMGHPLLSVADVPSALHVYPGGLRVAEYPIANDRLSGVAPAVKMIGKPLYGRSFPSGHTTAAFACAVGLVYAFRGRRRWLWLAPAAFVAVSRVACGVHFPLDVAVGAALGSGVSWALLRSTEVFHGLASPPRPRSAARAPGPTRVMMLVGEASADVYGARILEQLRRREPQLRAFGIGGELLQRAGLERHGDAAQLEIVGFTAVLTSLFTIVRLYLRMLRLLRRERPDALVCIDLPDFNFMLAQQARAHGVPAVFVISPQFWAWRSGRVAKLAPRISRMIVAFPFEVPSYERAGVPVAFHGHPLLEGLEPRPASRPQARAQLGLDPDRPLCVLAPGSRRSEWRHNLAALFAAAAKIGRQRPDVQFALPLAPRAAEERMRSAASRAGIEIRCLRGDSYGLFCAGDFGIVCSGTATLEAALAGLPMVIFYRSNWINALLARLLVETDRFGLPNIVLGGPEPVYPELFQERASAARLAETSLALLGDEAALARLREAGARVRQQLEGGDTSAAIADEILAAAGGPSGANAR